MNSYLRKYGAAGLILLVCLSGCSKPESKLIGKWVNESTASSIEFNKEHTGEIFQRTNPAMPPYIPFKWTMLDDRQFKVEVGAPGNSTAPVAKGRLEGDDTLILENDRFKKAK